MDTDSMFKCNISRVSQVIMFCAATHERDKNVPEEQSNELMMTLFSRYWVQRKK